MRRVTLLLPGVMLLASAIWAEAPANSGLEKLWQDLASTDDAQAARAILVLAAQPKETVPFLEKRLKPVKVDRKQVARWIEQLNSDQFEEREAATRELAYLSKFIQADLHQVLEGNPAAEVKKRVKELLERIPPEPGAKPAAPAIKRGSSIAVSNINGEIRILIDGQPLDLTPRVAPPSGPPPSWRQVVRAAMVLEHIGTPAAQAVLKKLAEGEKEALPTRVAREALERGQKKAN